MKVSVCMATYNGEAFIKEQLDSILCQLSPEDEVIISDDGSTDNTLSIIESYNNPRLKVYHHEPIIHKYSGLFKTIKTISSNFENALSYASGEYIFLTDQDDIWDNNKVSTILEALKTHDCVLHNARIIDNTNHITKPSLFIEKLNHITLFKTIAINNFTGCCMAFNKRILKIALPLPKYPIYHDIWIGLCSLTKGSVYYMHTPLISYRRHENNASPTSGKSKNSLFVKLKIRHYLLKSLIYLRKKN